MVPGHGIPRSSMLFVGSIWRSPVHLLVDASCGWRIPKPPASLNVNSRSVSAFRRHVSETVPHESSAATSGARGDLSMDSSVTNTSSRAVRSLPGPPGGGELPPTPPVALTKAYKMNLQRVEPFYERHEFTGQFILDDTETESVEVVVEFNKLESGPGSTPPEHPAHSSAAPGSAR